MMKQDDGMGQMKVILDDNDLEEAVTLLLNTKYGLTSLGPVEWAYIASATERRSVRIPAETVTATLDVEVVEPGKGPYRTPG